MARQTLDTNESGAYTGDGGTSNNAKVNANFEELYVRSFCVPVAVKPNSLVQIDILPSGFSGILLSASWRAATAPASAAGTILAAFCQGSDDAEIVAGESIENVGFAFDTGVPFSTGLYAKITSDNVDATGGLGGYLTGTYRLTSYA